MKPNNEEPFGYLSDEEFFRVFGEVYDEYISSKKDEDYEINPPQWFKLLRVIKYFIDLSKANNGKVEPCTLMPRLEHGGVTAYFRVLDFKVRDIPTLCEMLTQVSSITIDATTDGYVCVSVSVPNVYIEKQ